MFFVANPCSRHTARICNGKLLWQRTEYRPCQPEPSGLGLRGTFWLSPIANNTSEPGVTSAPCEAVAVISYKPMSLLAWYWAGVVSFTCTSQALRQSAAGIQEIRMSLHILPPSQSAGRVLRAAREARPGA